MAHHEPACLLVCLDDDCKKSTGYHQLVTAARRVDGGERVG